MSIDSKISDYNVDLFECVYLNQDKFLQNDSNFIEVKISWLRWNLNFKNQD